MQDVPLDIQREMDYSREEKGKGKEKEQEKEKDRDRDVENLASETRLELSPVRKQPSRGGDANESLDQPSLYRLESVFMESCLHVEV